MSNQLLTTEESQEVVLCCVNCGTELNEETGVLSSPDWYEDTRYVHYCRDCQQKQFEDFAENTSPAFAYFMCCAAYNIPFVPECMPSGAYDIDEITWLMYLENLETSDYRYKETFITGSRGLSKTFTKMAGAQPEMLLWPGEKIRYFASALNQGADLARSAFEQVSKNYPALTSQVIVRVSGKEDFALVTDTKSEFRITTKRGDNCNQVIAEECGQEDDTPFDWDRYKTVVDATNRKLHLVHGMRDPNHIDFKKHYITSGRVLVLPCSCR